MNAATAAQQPEASTAAARPESTTDATGHLAYPRPLSVATPEIFRAVDTIMRERAIMADARRADQRVLDEAEAPEESPVDVLTGSPVEIFDPRATFSLLAELDAAFREDGCVTDIGVRRNATGYITGLVIYHHRRNAEAGR